MMTTHRPILVEAVVEALCTDPQGSYVDATFGRGGHTRALLGRMSPAGSILAIDRDPTAVEVAQVLASEDARVIVRHGRMSDMVRFARDAQLTEVVGVLMDLGVSSPQLDDPERGMSFRGDGPLDMRMDPTAGAPASTWINEATESELAAVFFEFGEERHARRIARAIVERRVQSPILRTADLAALVARAQPRPDPHKHAATRVFQAIRIYLNEELDEVRMGIEAAFTLIRPGGRIAVLTFHSLEDRIVKRAFRRWAEGETLPRRLPVTGRPVVAARLLGRGRRPDAEEIAENPRARSALLRVLEKAA